MRKEAELECFQRGPAQVMRLARMGSAHPTRLSFLRIMLRRMQADGWRFDRPLWDVGGQGVGRAVYRAVGPERVYSLVAFSHDLPPHMRTDRVIATAWDATFALFDGEPTAADLDRLATNVPLQEGGRVTGRELTLSRANRSVRLFQYVVERLAAGLQPDPEEVTAVGYLMRTTAVYGSGKFGAADRARYADRAELQAPFQAEMLSVWLIRAFTVDLVEHLARVKGGSAAVKLSPAIKRGLGVGNSTGLGMAPFLVRHPLLLDRWMRAQETALARVRALPEADAAATAKLHDAVAAAQANARHWRSDHPMQRKKLDDLRGDLESIATRVKNWPAAEPYPWDAFWRWGEGLSLEGQEALAALMLEPHGALVDDLADSMSADEAAAFRIDGAMPAGVLRRLLREYYDWALPIDFSRPENLARFWYVSEEKLEPRLGSRANEAGSEREQPLGIAWYASALAAALEGIEDETPLAAFLLSHPEHRYMVRRAQIAGQHAFAEIHDNLFAADMLPIDMLRCKLAFFGASRFDPRSDRWVRISLFQDEPYPKDFGPPASRQEFAASQNRCDEPTGYSTSELEALGLKAARGAGLSWGLAEEAGFASGWLYARGLDGPALLLQRLRRSADVVPPQWDADGNFEPVAGGCICPVALGVALSDFATLWVLPLCAGTVDCPALLLPFIGQAAAARRHPLTLIWDGGSVGISPAGGISGELASLLTTATAAISISSASGSLPAVLASSLSRETLHQSTLAGLEALAMRTTVPASDASRADAGSFEDDDG